MGRREAFPNGSAVLVINHATRLIEHFPAPLPGQISDVGVFHIERRQQFVESAQFQKFSPVERTGSSAAIGAWIGNLDGRIVAMANPKRSVLPPELREAGFLAQLVWIAKKDLASH